MAKIEIKHEMLACTYVQWPAPLDVRAKALSLLSAAIEILMVLGLEANEIELQEFLEWLPESPRKNVIEDAALAYMKAIRSVARGFD